MIDNPKEFIAEIVNRLQDCVTDHLSTALTEDDNLTVESKQIGNNSTEYSIKVTLATLERDGNLYYDVQGQAPIEDCNVESYLKHKIYLKSLLLSGLSNNAKFINSNKYTRIADNRVFCFKDIALNEQSGKKWCVLEEESSDKLLIITPLESIERDYKVIPS